MKISIRPFLSMVSALALLAFSAAPLGAANKAPKPPAEEESEHDHEDVAGTTVRTKFSDPSKPGMLKLSLPWAEVRITGTDGNEVVVTSTLAQKGKGEVDDEGFRRLDEEVSFELTEKNNVATIVIVGDNPWAAHDAEFIVQVPRSTNLSLETQTGGDIKVDGVAGEIDINSMNGDVTLTDPRSAAVVNTMNGEITAIFKTAPVKPVSLSSMNGEIALTLPSETKANLRMRSHNGSIRTNFPDAILQSKSESRAVSGDGSDGEVSAARYQRDVERAMRDAERAVAEAEKAAAEAEKAAARADADAQKAAIVAVNAKAHVIATPVVVPAPKAPRAPKAPHIPLPPFGGKSIVGTLNGGGIDIQLATMNGSITLRKGE